MGGIPQQAAWKRETWGSPKIRRCGVCNAALSKFQRKWCAKHAHVGKRMWADRQSAERAQQREEYRQAAAIIYGLPWLPEEDSRIRQLAGQRVMVAEIAKQLRRGERATRERMRLLGLTMPRKPRSTGYTEADAQLVRERVAQGVCFLSIGLELDWSPTKARNLALKMGLKVVPRGMSEETKAEILRLRGLGMERGAIARKLGLSRNTVIGFVWKHERAAGAHA